MPLEKKIEVKKVEGNGEFEEVEDHKKALADHIKKQMEERDNVKETVKSLDAIQHAADILQVEGRLHRLEDIIVALQEEELPVLPEYQEKVKELGEHLSEKKEIFPEVISAAIAALDRKALLAFIDEAMSYHKNEEFKYMVANFTDEHKETVYDLIHSEEVKDKDHEELIWRFESLMGFSMKIVEEEILKDLDPSLDAFRDFIRKYVRKLDGKVRAQLEVMKTWKDFNLSDKMIERYAESTIRRFGIEEAGEEVTKEAFEEFKIILAKMMSEKE